jgi:hypothetical protein
MLHAAEAELGVGGGGRVGGPNQVAGNIFGSKASTFPPKLGIKPGSHGGGDLWLCKQSFWDQSLHTLQTALEKQQPPLFQKGEEKKMFAQHTSRFYCGYGLECIWPSGSVIILYGSGSFHQQAKKERKT